MRGFRHLAFEFLFANWHAAQYRNMFASLRWQDHVAILGMVLAVLFPIGLTLWMRRRALASSAEERSGIWFGYCKFLQFISLAVFLFWFFAMSMPVVEFFVDSFRGDGGRQLSTAISLAIVYVPSLLTILICVGLSHPIYADIRNCKLSRRELIQLWLLSYSVYVFPLTFACLGTAALSEDSYTWAFVWFAVAIANWVYFGRRLTSIRQVALHALTCGELRDRVFELAKNADVQLHQVYLRDTSASLEANAAAIRSSSGGHVVLTDYLLENLNRREVDAVIAHELAHLKYRHGAHWFVRLLLLIVVGQLGFRYISAEFSFDIPFGSFLTMIATLLLYGFWKNARSRSWERAADGSVVGITGDAEAQITSLAKLGRLNMLPTDWGRYHETWSTHPSFRRRIEAVRRREGISSERIDEFLQAVDESDHYDVPREVFADERVFSSQFKQKLLSRHVWTVMALLAIVPAFYAAIGAHLGWFDAGWSWLAALLAIAVNVSAYFLYSDLQRTTALIGLRSGLADQFQAEGLELDALDGQFVAFSPHATPRVYEGFTNWDVGFLYLLGNRLIYLGEQTRFALNQDQVLGLRTGPTSPQPLTSRCVYVEWEDIARDSRGTFNLSPIAGATMAANKRAFPAFEERLRSWWQADRSPSIEPEPLRKLTTPEIGDVTSGSPRDAINLPSMLFSALLLTVIAIAASFLCGLSFQSEAQLASLVVLTANVSLVVLNLPLRYRECSGDLF